MPTAWPAIALTNTHGANATLYAHGAHLTRWQSASGKDWLFTSREAVYAEGKAIRGGVPIIFPQFNERGPGPRHGFVRQLPWQVIHMPAEAAACAECEMGFESNDHTLTLWPHQFDARFRVQLFDQRLAMTLEITNTDGQPFSFTAALHSYFAIASLPQTRVGGLAGTTFWDNGTPFTARHRAGDADLDLSDAIDRVYFDLQRPLVLEDAQHRLQIEQTGFTDAVVWNPGRDGARALPDMADDEFERMLCIEAAAIDHPVTLAPGETWVGAQILREL